MRAITLLTILNLLAEDVALEVALVRPMGPGGALGAPLSLLNGLGLLLGGGCVELSTDPELI